MNKKNQNSSSKIGTEIKISILETLETASIHALPKIVKNEYKSIKLVWLTLFIVSTGACAYVCYKKVVDYLDFDVVTKIEVKSLNIVDFPMIRICDLNIFTSTYSIEMTKEILSSYNLTLSEFENPSFNKKNKMTNQSEFLIKYRLNRYLVSSNIISKDETLKRKIGRNLNEFLIACVYGLHPCIIEEFSYYFDFIYGNCFLFNSGKNVYNKSIVIRQSAQTGSLNGLNLEFLVGSEEDNNMPFSSFNGLNIYITDQGFLNVFTDGINISPGFSTNIIIQKTKISKQPSPYSECTADLTSPDSYKSDIYKKLMNFSSRYDYKSCQLMCYQKQLGITCNCQDPSIYRFYSNLQLCLANDTFWCNIVEFQKFLVSNSFSRCDCPKECETTVFSYSTSISKFPTISYAKSLLNNPEVLAKFNKTNVTFDDLRKNIASVNIFYNDISEQIVTQQPKMDLFDLISSIGGILGLFLGMSLLSFAEFIEIIMESFFIWFKYSTQKNQLKPN